LSHSRLRRAAKPKAIAVKIDRSQRITQRHSFVRVHDVPRGCLVSKAGAVSMRRQVEVKRALGHVLHWPELTGL